MLYHKDEYYKKVIMNIIDKVPNDDLEKKILLQSCISLLDLSKKYTLYEKINILKN